MELVNYPKQEKIRCFDIEAIEIPIVYNKYGDYDPNRLKRDSRISKVFSSKIHGDPATPIFKAYTGERVIFRTMMPADKPRNVSFCLHGHEWKQQQKNPHSRIISVQGAISVGNTFNMELKEGASGIPSIKYVLEVHFRL